MEKKHAVFGCLPFLTIPSLLILGSFSSENVITAKTECKKELNFLLFQQRGYQHRSHTHSVQRACDSPCRSWFSTNSSMLMKLFYKVKVSVMEITSLQLVWNLMSCQELKFRVKDPSLINVHPHISTQHPPCRKIPASNSGWLALLKAEYKDQQSNILRNSIYQKISQPKDDVMSYLLAIMGTPGISGAANATAQS